MGAATDSQDLNRKNRVPPGQRLTKDFPVLHHGTVPAIDIEEWRFRIWGLVEREATLDHREFLALPRVQVRSDIHCVTAWSRLDNLWEGVAASEVIRLAGAKPGARHAMVHGAGGFTANLRLEDLLQPDVLFAIRHDGKDLTPEHGWPVRLVVPRLYFWKSAKWLEGIELTADQRLGYWETRGYHALGDPWLEQRYS
jgi:DMSO/TMAO reductase YedYZ molybdopterin-dependent catalytic subunit